MTTDLSTPEGVAQALLDAVKNGQYRVAAALGLVAVVFGVRWIAPKLQGRLGAWLNSDRGGAALSLIVGVAGSIATSLIAGKPLSFALLLSGVVMAATGSGLFNLGKKIAKPADKPPGQSVATPNAPPPGASGVVPALLLLLPLLSACGFCKLPEKVQEPRCVLERNLIACGEQAGYSILPVVLSVIGQAIGGHFDSGALVSQLEAQGFKNLPCALSALQDYLLPTAPQLSAQLHESLKVALIRKGMHGAVDIRLKSGKVVSAVIP